MVDDFEHYSMLGEMVENERGKIEVRIGRLKEFGDPGKKFGGNPYKTIEIIFLKTNIKIRNNAAKNYILRNLLLNLGFSKDLG